MKNSVDRLIGKKLKVINMGLQQFSEQLQKEDQDFVQMAWQPPAGGDMELLEILDRLRDDE